MTSLAQQHFTKTKELTQKISKDKIAEWLLREGYYPEQYVLPPCFCVKEFSLRIDPYFKVTPDNGKKRYRVTRSDLLSIFFPKSHLTDRVFGIMEPQIYHDIVFHLMNNWDFVQGKVFHEDILLFSYSFPIPVTEDTLGDLGTLRSGRMIYEYIEMAENDLIADAHRFQYIITTDIKNFYPSIYTHSLSWALHEKELARRDDEYDLFGNKIDKLLQYANDRCTNGLAIGPVVSDLAAEILLAVIDRNCSNDLRRIDFLGVRFKDDYKVLCQSRSDADQIIKTLQRHMRMYNLNLNEGKTTVKELPEGIFRPWILEYQPFSFKKEDEISYRKFETTLLEVLKIDSKYPDTGIIDKFLSELITKDYQLKVSLEEKQWLKAISLLFMLKKRRAKSFPLILAIMELMIKKYNENPKLKDTIIYNIGKHLQDKSDELYDALWIVYFLKSQGHEIVPLPSIDQNSLLRSIRDNKQLFFDSKSEIQLFKPINDPGKNKPLAQHLAIFPKDED